MAWGLRVLSNCAAQWELLYMRIIYCNGNIYALLQWTQEDLFRSVTWLTRYRSVLLDFILHTLCRKLVKEYAIAVRLVFFIRHFLHDPFRTALCTLVCQMLFSHEQKFHIYFCNQQQVARLSPMGPYLRVVFQTHAYIRTQSIHMHKRTYLHINFLTYILARACTCYNFVSCIQTVHKQLYVKCRIVGEWIHRDTAKWKNFSRFCRSSF
jgi:hypothetical protein